MNRYLGLFGEVRPELNDITLILIFFIVEPCPSLSAVWAGVLEQSYPCLVSSRLARQKPPLDQHYKWR